MITGQINLNAVPGDGMITIIEAQKQVPTLSIAQSQPVPIGQGEGKAPLTGYNLTLVWNDHSAFAALSALLPKLAALAP
jgi:hypothetical protein